MCFKGRLGPRNWSVFLDTCFRLLIPKVRTHVCLYYSFMNPNSQNFLKNLKVSNLSFCSLLLTPLLLATNACSANGEVKILVDCENPLEWNIIK